MEIFKLVGSVFIDTDKANDSLQKTDEKATSTAEKLKTAAGTVGKLAVGIAGTATAGAAALMGFANQAASAADTVDKGSIRMGVSTDAYQELSYAAGQCGIEMSTMEAAAKKLEGTDLSFDDAINQIMSLGTEEERSAAAADLFGDKIAYTLSPILASSGEDFQSLRDRAHDLGLVMSEESVAAGVTMGDTMSDVQQSLSAVGTQIGASVMPIVQKMLDWILQHMPQIQQVVQTAISFIQGLISDLMPMIENLMPVVEKVFSFVMTLWNDSLKPMLDGVIEFLNGVFTGDWEKVWEGLGKIVDGVFSGLVDIVRVPINTIIGFVNELIEGINSIDAPEWVPIIGGSHLSIPTIPKLAKGGVVSDSGYAMVGEAGAELVNLPAGASVVPLNSNNNDFSEMQKTIEAMYQLMAKYLPAGITLDTGVLVGGIANQMDKSLYYRQAIAARGL